MQKLLRSLPWTLVVPGVAVLALVLTWGRKPGDAVLAIVAAFLAGAVLASVHHAEVDHHDTPRPVDGQRAARRLARPRAGPSRSEGAKAQDEDELPHGSDQVSVPGV